MKPVAPGSISRLLLDAQRQVCLATPHQEQHALHAFSQGCYLQAEQHLLSRLAESEIDLEIRADQLWLLFQLYSQQWVAEPLRGLLRRLAMRVPPDDQRLQHLLLQTSRLRREVSRGPTKASASLHSHGTFPHLDLEISAALLSEGQLDQAEVALEQSEATASCEAILLRAQLLQFRGQRSTAESLLLDHWPSYRHRLDYGLQLVELLFELRRGELCLPVLKEAVAAQGSFGSPLLERFSQARMLQRQTGIALRLKLQERLPKQSGAPVSAPTILGAIYDSLGRSDWLVHLPAPMEVVNSFTFDLHSSRLMHLSSRASSLYPQACQSVVALLEHTLEVQIRPFARSLQANNSERLRVGWICADIANHPVARFLLSWLGAAEGKLQHKHSVIGIVPADPRYALLFEQLPGVEFIDQSAPGHPAERIERLRQLNLDVAIDLNGWTGNHFAAAFIARVAPIQLNYLAYHASSGIPAMDAWVVDQQLLPPEPECEWHSEPLLRLPRAFLAWQPHPELPEAQANVSTAAFTADEGIRYGCFNHLRKISDEALQCWARILTAQPTARLVLKAHSAEDSATATLLQRRLERSGLPLQQVIWLPYTATPNEHLEQYAQMDVALDSFPNTGCTTTCEALWMGVPVITLAGSHYVSRMAAAVLHAARLPEWICHSTTDYEQLALAQGEPQRLAWLRSHRSLWREQIQHSPLGDARDLIKQLETAFSELARQRLHEQTLKLSTHTPGLIQR